MPVRCLMALVAGLALAAPAPAADPPKKADPADALLETLFQQEVNLPDGARVGDTPLFEVLQLLSKKFDVPFGINEEAFRAESVIDIRNEKAKFGLTTTKGLTTHQFLTTMLDGLSGIRATYLIKNGAIEIVPLAHAGRVTKSAVVEGEDSLPKLAQPIVSAVLKEKPLNEAVALIAERYDLNIIVSPQAGDAKTGFVTARLLNVPADRALELLAVQNDLRVVRKGNAFLITSKDHADAMFGERLERERQKIELEKFRNAPPPVPEPEPKPKM